MPNTGDLPWCVVLMLPFPSIYLLVVTDLRCTHSCVEDQWILPQDRVFFVAMGGCLARLAPSALRLQALLGSLGCLVGGVRTLGRRPRVERRSRPAAGDVHGCWPAVLVAWAVRSQRVLVTVRGRCQRPSSPYLKAGPLPLSGTLLLAGSSSSCQLWIRSGDGGVCLVPGETLGRLVRPRWP
jgi:hypothetical protein